LSFNLRYSCHRTWSRWHPRLWRARW